MAATWVPAAVAGAVSSAIRGSYGPVGSGVASVRSTADGRREVVVALTTDSAGNTYTTAGDELDLSLVGLDEVREAYVVADDAVTQAGYRLTLDLTDPLAPLVKLYDEAGEIAAATAVNDQNFTVKLIGH